MYTKFTLAEWFRHVPYWRVGTLSHEFEPCWNHFVFPLSYQLSLSVSLSVSVSLSLIFKN